jgi:hypothetical protein
MKREDEEMSREDRALSAEPKLEEEAYRAP